MAYINTLVIGMVISCFATFSSGTVDTQNVLESVFRNTNSQSESKAEHLKHDSKESKRQTGNTSTQNSSLVERMSRILVFKGRLQGPFFPDQINIRTNEISPYPYLYISKVNSLAYDPTSRRIIFNRFTPANISASELDVAGVHSLLGHVRSLGMAVDVDRHLVVMTTYYRGKTISKMTTQGRNFSRVVDLSTNGNFQPVGLALDTRDEFIYFSQFDRISSVRYDGTGLRMLYSARRGIESVAINTDFDTIYFSERKKVMEMPLPNGRAVKLVELDTVVCNLIFYENSLYISSYIPGSVDVLHLGNYPLAVVNVRNSTNTSYRIVLVP